VPRADVWVFDAADPGSGVGGTPLRIVELFGDTPRALAVSPDGGTVYAAVFHSGNQTTSVSEGIVCNGFAGAGACAGDGTTSPGGLLSGQLPGGNPGPSVNFEGVTAPEVGLIVQWNRDAEEWRDELGRNWNNAVRFHLPDRDVFAIDVASLAPGATFAHVGTILFNMVVNPATGALYVSNTEAQNLVRFEGPGIAGPTTVQGDLARSQITVIAPLSGIVTPRHLNGHIDYSALPAPAGTREHSVATPLEMVLSADNSRLYVAAFGSSRIGVYDTAALEAGSLDPTVASADFIELSGGGPSGLVLDEPGNRLFVATRFDNAVAIVDLETGTEIDSVALHNPEPESVVAGRPFLYDADRTSSNGEASCASCHLFGDLDSLAWDLGDPDAPVTRNPIPQTIVGGSDQNGGAAFNEFHPMKGPMTTQTLRGLQNAGAMHWRGDRADGFFGFDSPYVKMTGVDNGNEALSFDNFIVAFEGLVGRETHLADADMELFTTFAMQLMLPPNPVRALDNSLTDAQEAGRTFYFGRTSDVVLTCNGCHTLAPENGFFGTGGLASFENETQIFKIAHLRNLYQKIGMFGMPSIDFILPGDNAHKGDQVRGFGFLHDGSIDTIFRFFRATVFNFGPALGFANETEQRDMEAFMLAFDTDLAPIVGQQVTLTATNLMTVQDRIDLLLARAAAPFVSKLLGGSSHECDVVVKGVVDGEPRGWRYDRTTNQFQPDRNAEPALAKAALLELAEVPGQELTFTAAPTGSGVRMGIDRDLDTLLDGDDNCPAAANPSQEDENGDGIGNACDPLFVPEPGGAAGALAACVALVALGARRRQRVTVA
jgi:DNA-binding beta-propeller fold protein YncE